jgi:hypothetical protein
MKSLALGKQIKPSPSPRQEFREANNETGETAGK